MDENFLLKVSIACSIIGLAVLYIISGRFTPDEASISKITMGQAEGVVVTSGRISSITENENVLILELQKNEKISVVMFRDDYPDYMALNKGDLVEVSGKVEDYRGKKEIIAENVRFLGGGG